MENINLVKISPNYYVTILEEPVSVDTYIDIYEDRLKFWIFRPAKILLNYKHGGYAILYLLASYFESYSEYNNGKKVIEKKEIISNKDFYQYSQKFLHLDTLIWKLNK